MNDAAARYDKALARSYALNPLPQNVRTPLPTNYWPPENVALLQRYHDWLVAGGSSFAVINSHRIPMAGHVLGLFRKSHSQLSLSDDLEAAMVYVEAKQPSQSWLKNCRHSLNWFRRFLRQERGLAPPPNFVSPPVDHFREGLPEWLLAELDAYQQLRQANWRPSRLDQFIYQFWFRHTRIWGWLCLEQSVTQIDEIDCPLLYRYIDQRLADGVTPQTINQELYHFQGSLRFMQQRGRSVPHTLLTLPGLKQPQSLPRFLTDEQIGKLQAVFEQRLKTADTPTRHRDARLDKALFQLLWQGGLRVSEIEEIRLNDIDTANQRLHVRCTKGLTERTIYLTETTLTALADYQTVRGQGESDHLFLFRHRPLKKEFIRFRLKAAGKRAGFHVTPHMLRHTFATQLLNSGCEVTTIQRLLGHRRLTTTMVYARVHDQTVARDYFSAMTQIEATCQPPAKATDDTTAQLQALAQRLANDGLTDQQQTLLDELLQSLQTQSMSHVP